LSDIVIILRNQRALSQKVVRRRVIVIEDRAEVESARQPRLPISDGLPVGAAKPLT
jgi:hypothetical protein